MNYFVMFLPVGLVSSLVNFVIGSDELLQVQAIFRHGSRAPMYEFSNKESEKYYYKGKGMLTDEGLKQAHKFGHALKQRYVDNGFLDKRYIPSEVKFRSSGKPRCLITASAVGQAMFEKSSDGMPNSVEVQTIPTDQDFLCIHQTPKKLLKELFDTAGLPMKQNKSQDGLANALTDIWGKKSKYLKHVGKLSSLTEPLLIENAKGLMKTPGWYNKSAEKEFKHILYKSMSFVGGTGEFHCPQWIRCRSGLMMYTIMDNIKKRSSCKKDKCKEPKLYAYSTHEYIIQSLLDSFSIINETLEGETPPDTAAILIELWKGGKLEGHHYVKLFYGRQNKEFKEYTKDLPACKGTSDCPMERFTGCCDKYMTSHPADECGGSGDNTTGT